MDIRLLTYSPEISEVLESGEHRSKKSPHTICVILGELLSSSVLCFFIWRMGITVAPTSTGGPEGEMYQCT